MEVLDLLFRLAIAVFMAATILWEKTASERITRLERRLSELEMLMQRTRRS